MEFIKFLLGLSCIAFLILTIIGMAEDFREKTINILALISFVVAAICISIVTAVGSGIDLTTIEFVIKG